jgi:hypothetical protein
LGYNGINRLQSVLSQGATTHIESLHPVLADCSSLRDCLRFPSSMCTKREAFCRQLNIRMKTPATTFIKHSYPDLPKTCSTFIWLLLEFCLNTIFVLLGKHQEISLCINVFVFIVTRCLNLTFLRPKRHCETRTSRQANTDTVRSVHYLSMTNSINTKKHPIATYKSKNLVINFDKSDSDPLVLVLWVYGTLTKNKVKK